MIDIVRRNSVIVTHKSKRANGQGSRGKLCFSFFSLTHEHFLKTVKKCVSVNVTLTMILPQ